MKTTELKQALQKQPVSTIVALAVFFLPIGVIWLLVGPVGAVGAILYLASWFLMGDVNVKFLTLKQRAGRKPMERYAFTFSEDPAEPVKEAEAPSHGLKLTLPEPEVA